MKQLLLLIGILAGCQVFANPLSCQKIHSLQREFEKMNPVEREIWVGLEAFEKKHLSEKFEPGTEFGFRRSQIAIFNEYQKKRNLDLKSLATHWVAASRLIGESVYPQVPEVPGKILWNRPALAEITLQIFEMHNQGKLNDVHAARTAQKIQEVTKMLLIPSVEMREFETKYGFLMPHWNQSLEIVRLMEKLSLNPDHLQKEFDRFVRQFDYNNGRYQVLTESQQQKLFYQLFILRLADPAGLKSPGPY